VPLFVVTFWRHLNWTDTRQHEIYLLNIYFVLYLTYLLSELVKRRAKPVKRGSERSSSDLLSAMRLTMHCQSSLWRFAGEVFNEGNKHTLFCKHTFISVVLCTLLPGLPCEGIMSPPHGRMNCSGLVTNDTCLFACDAGYELQGSEKRTCLNSSNWDGQQASCVGNFDFYFISFLS